MLDKDSTNPATTTKSNRNEDTPGEGNPENVTPSTATKINERSRGDSSRSDTLVIATYVANDDDDNPDISHNVGIDNDSENVAAECQNGVESEHNNINHLLSIVRLCEGPSTSAAQTRRNSHNKNNNNDLSQKQSSNGTSDGKTSKTTITHQQRPLQQPVSATTATKNSGHHTTPLVVNADSADDDDDELSIVYKNTNNEMISSKQQSPLPPPLPPRRPTISVKYFSPVEDDDVIMTSPTNTIGDGMDQRIRTECDKNMAGPSSKVTQNLQLRDRKTSFSTTNEMSMPSTAAPVEIIDLELMPETRGRGCESPSNSSVISVSTSHPARSMSMLAGRRMVCMKHIKRAPKEPEEYIEALFPHVREAHQRIRQALLHSPLTDVKDNALLKRKMLEVIQLYARGCKNEFERVGNSAVLCRRLKRNIVRLLDLFNEICLSSRQDQVYLYHISQLIAVYNSLEIRLSLSLTRLQKCALIHRLAHVINKHLIVNDEALSKENILRMFLHMPDMYSARFIMEPILNTFLPEIHTSTKSDSQKELPDKTFVQYIIILHQWKEMLRDPLEQIELINKAQQFMCPTKTLHSNSIYANHLPTIHTRKSAVKDILNNLKFFHDLKNAAISDDTLQGVDEDIIVLIDEDTNTPVWDFGASYTAEPKHLRPKTQARKFASEPVECVDLTLDEDQHLEEKVENHLIWLTSLKEKASDKVLIDETENVICLDSDDSDGELFSGSILDPSESYQDCDAFDTDYTSLDGSTTDDKGGSEDETLPTSRITPDGLRTYLAPRSRRNSHISSNNDEKRTTTYTRRSVHMGSPYVRTRVDGDGDFDGEGDSATVSSRINSDSDTPWPLILNTFTVGSKKSKHLSRFSRFSTDVRSEHFEDENINEMQEQNTDEGDEDGDDDDDVFHSLPSTASSSRTTMGKVIYSQALPESDRRCTKEQDIVHKGLKSASEKLSNLDNGRRSDNNGKQRKAKLDNERNIEDSAMQLHINAEDKNHKPVKKQVKFNDKPIGPTRPLSTNDITKLPIKPAIHLNKTQCSQNHPCTTNNQHCFNQHYFKQKDYNQHNCNQDNFNQHYSNQHDCNQHNFNQHNYNQHDYNQHDYNQHDYNQHDSNQHCCNQHQDYNQQPIQSSSPKPRFASPTSSTTSSTTESLKHMAQQGRRILDRFKLSKTANVSKCSSATIIDSESDDIIDVISSDSANKTDNTLIISTQSLQIENSSTENELLDFSEKSISPKNSEYQMKTRSFSNHTTVMCRPKDISSTNNNNSNNNNTHENKSNMHLNDDYKVDDNNDNIQSSSGGLGILERGKKFEIEEQNSNVSTTTGPNNESLTADEHTNCISNISKQTLVMVESGTSLDTNVGSSDICTSSTSETFLQECDLDCNAVSTQLVSSDDNTQQSGKQRFLGLRVLRGKTAQASKIVPLSTKKVVSKVRKRYTEVGNRKSTLRGASSASKALLQKELLVDSSNKNISTKQNDNKSITEDISNKSGEQNAEKVTNAFLKEGVAAMEEENISIEEITTNSIAENIPIRKSSEKIINEILTQDEYKKDESISTKQNNAKSLTNGIPNKCGEQTTEKVPETILKKDVTTIDKNISTRQKKTKGEVEQTAEKVVEAKKETNISTKHIQKTTCLSDEKDTKKVTVKTLKQKVAPKDKRITTKQGKTKIITAKLSSKSSDQNTEEIFPKDEQTKENNISKKQNKTKIGDKPILEKIPSKAGEKNSEETHYEHTIEKNMSTKQNETKTDTGKSQNKRKETEVTLEPNVSIKEKSIYTGQKNSESTNEKTNIKEKSTEKNAKGCFTTEINQIDIATSTSNVVDQFSFDNLEPVNEMEKFLENSANSQESPVVEQIAETSEVNNQDTKMQNEDTYQRCKKIEEIEKLDSDKLTDRSSDLSETVQDKVQKQTIEKTEVNLDVLPAMPDEIVRRQPCDVTRSETNMGITLGRETGEHVTEKDKLETNLEARSSKKEKVLEVQTITMEVDNTSKKLEIVVVEQPHSQTATCLTTDETSVHQSDETEKTEDDKRTVKILKKVTSDKSIKQKKQQGGLPASISLEEKSDQKTARENKVVLRKSTRKSKSKSEQSSSSKTQKQTEDPINLRIYDCVGEQSSELEEKTIPIDITQSPESYSKSKSETENSEKCLKIKQILSDEVKVNLTEKTEFERKQETTCTEKNTKRRFTTEINQIDIDTSTLNIVEQFSFENLEPLNEMVNISTNSQESPVVEKIAETSEHNKNTDQPCDVPHSHSSSAEATETEVESIKKIEEITKVDAEKLTDISSDLSEAVQDKVQKPTIEKTEVNVKVLAAMQDGIERRQPIDVTRSDSTMEITLGRETGEDGTEKDLETNLEACSSKKGKVLKVQTIKTMEVANTLKKLEIVVVEQPQSQRATCLPTDEISVHESDKTEKTEDDKRTVKILKKVATDKSIKQKKQQGGLPDSISLKENTDQKTAEENKVVLRKSTRKSQSKSKSEQSSSSKSQKQMEEQEDEKTIPSDIIQPSASYFIYTSETENPGKCVKIVEILSDEVKENLTERTEFERKLEPTCELENSTKTTPLLNLEECLTIKPATSNEVESEEIKKTVKLMSFSEDQQADGSSNPNVPMNKSEQTSTFSTDEPQTTKQESPDEVKGKLNKKTENSSMQTIKQKLSNETENLTGRIVSLNSEEYLAKDETKLITQYSKSIIPMKPEKQKPKSQTKNLTETSPVNFEECPIENRKISDESEAKSSSKKSGKRRARFSVDVALHRTSDITKPIVPIKTSMQQPNCETRNLTERPSSALNSEEYPNTKKHITSDEVKEVKSNKKSEKRLVYFSIDEAPIPDNFSESSVPIKISKQMSEPSCETVSATETQISLTSDDVVDAKLIKKSEKRRVRFSIDVTPQTKDDFPKPNMPKKISKQNPVGKTECLTDSTIPSLVSMDLLDKNSAPLSENVAELKSGKKSEKRRVRFSIDEAPQVSDVTNLSVHQKRSTQELTTENKTLKETPPFHLNLEELFAKKQTPLQEAELKSIKKSEKRRARFTIDVAPPPRATEFSISNFTIETSKQDSESMCETENLSKTRPTLSSDEYLNIRQTFSDEAEVKLFKKTAIQKLIDDNERNITKKREKRKKVRGSPHCDVPSTSSSASRITETNEDLVGSKAIIRDTYTKKKSNSRARSNSCDGLICLIKAVEAINLAANDSEQSSSNSVVDVEESKRGIFKNDKIINIDNQNFSFDYNSKNDVAEFIQNAPNSITELSDAGVTEGNSLAANAVENIEFTDKFETREKNIINDTIATKTNLDRLAEAAMFTEAFTQQFDDDTSSLSPIDVKETEFSSTNTNMNGSQNVETPPLTTIPAVRTLETANPTTGTKTEIKMHRRSSRAAKVVPECLSVTEKAIENDLTSPVANILNDSISKKDTNSELKDEESAFKSTLPKNIVSSFLHATESSTTTSSDSEIETTTKSSDMLLRSEQWKVINNTGVANSSLEHSREDVDIKKNVDDKLNKRSIKIRLAKTKMPTTNKNKNQPPIDSSTDEAVKNLESEFGDVSYRPITRKLSAALNHTLQMDTDSSIIDPIEPLFKRGRKTKAKMTESTVNEDVPDKRRKLEEEKLQSDVKDDVIDLTLMEDENSVKSVLSESQSEKSISPKRKMTAKREKIEKNTKDASEKTPKGNDISDADFLEQIRMKHASKTRGTEKHNNTKVRMQQESQMIETSSSEKSTMVVSSENQSKEPPTSPSLGEITKRLKISKAEKKQKEKNISDTNFLECIKRKHTSKMKDTEKQQEITLDTKEESQQQNKIKLSKNYSNKNTNTYESRKKTDDDGLIESSNDTAEIESLNVNATESRKNLKNSSKNSEKAEFIQTMLDSEVDVDKSVAEGQTQQNSTELPNDLYEKINTKKCQRNPKSTIQKSNQEESVAHTDENEMNVVVNETVSEEEYEQKGLTGLLKNCTKEENITNASNTSRNDECHELASGDEIKFDKTVTEKQYRPNLENLLEYELNGKISSNVSDANETDCWTVSSDDEDSDDPTTVHRVTVADDELNVGHTVIKGKSQQNSTDEVSTEKHEGNLKSSSINNSENESNQSPDADGTSLEKSNIEIDSKGNLKSSLINATENEATRSVTVTLHKDSNSLLKPLLADISEFTSLSLSSINRRNSNSQNSSFGNSDSQILKEQGNTRQNNTNCCIDMDSHKTNVNADKVLEENSKFNYSDSSHSYSSSCSYSATSEVTSEADLYKNELTSFKVVPSETQVSELILNTSTSIQDLSLIYLENEIMSNDALLTELIMDIMTTPALEHNYATTPNEKVMMTKKYELKNYDDKQIKSELLLPQILRNKKTTKDINEDKDYQETINNEDNSNNEKSIGIRQLKVSIPLQNIKGIEEIKKKEKLKENWYLTEEPCTFKAAALKRREIDNLTTKAYEKSCATLKEEEKEERNEEEEMQFSEDRLSKDTKRPRTPEGENERGNYCASPSFQMEKRRKISGVMADKEDNENLFTDKKRGSNGSPIENKANQLDESDTNTNEDTTNISIAMATTTVNEELEFCENVLLDDKLDILSTNEDFDTQFDKIKRNLEKEFAKIESNECRDNDDQNKSTENIQADQQEYEKENPSSDTPKENFTNQQQTNRDTIKVHKNEIQEIQPINTKDCEKETEEGEQLLERENEFKDVLDFLPQTEDNQSKKNQENQQIQQTSNACPTEKESNRGNDINEEKVEEDGNEVKKTNKASISPQAEDMLETNRTQAQTENLTEHNKTIQEKQNLQLNNRDQRSVIDLNNDQRVGIEKQSSDHAIDHDLITTNVECDAKIAKDNILRDVTDDNMKDISMAELQESAIESLIENTNYNNNHHANEVTLTHYEDEFFVVNTCLNDSDNVNGFKVQNSNLGGGFKARNDALISAQDMKDDSNDFLSIKTNSQENTATSLTTDTNLDTVTDLLKTNELIDFTTNLTNEATSPTANTIDHSFPNASNLANMPSTTTQEDLFPNLVAPTTITTPPPPPAATTTRSLSLDMPSLASCDFDIEPDTTNNPPNITDLAQINELSSYAERESLQTPTPINQPTSSNTFLAATKTSDTAVEGNLDSSVSTTKATSTATFANQSSELSAIGPPLLLQKETTTTNNDTTDTDGTTNTQPHLNLTEIEKSDKAAGLSSSKSIKLQRLSSPSRSERTGIDICSSPSPSSTASTKTSKLTNSPFSTPSKLRLQPTRVSTRARAPARVQIVTPQRKNHDNATKKALEERKSTTDLILPSTSETFCATMDLNQNQISTTLPPTYPSDPPVSSSSPSNTTTTSTTTKTPHVVKRQANILHFEKYIQKLMGLMDVPTIIKSARNLLVDKNALADAHAAILAHVSQYDSEGNEISQPLILKDHKDGTISITYDNDESILLTSSLSKMVKKLSLALSILQEQQTASGGLCKRARIEKLLKKLTETPAVVKTTQAQVLSSSSAIPTAVVNPTNLAENSRDMMDLSTLNNMELFNRGSGGGGCGVVKQSTVNHQQQQHQAQHATLHTNWRDMERNILTKTISNGDLPLANEDQLIDIDPLPLLEDEGTAGDYEHGVAFDFEDSLTMLSTTNGQAFENPFDDVLGGDGDAAASANGEENVWNNLEQNGDIMMAANWQVEDCNNDVNLWQEHNGGMQNISSSSSSNNNNNENNNMDVEEEEEEDANYDCEDGDDINDDGFVLGDADADANANDDDFVGNDQNGITSITEVPASSCRRQRAFDEHQLRTMQPQSLNLNHSKKITPTAATNTTALVERISKMRTNIVTATEDGIFQTPLQRRISTQNNTVNLSQQQQQQQQNHSSKIHYRLSVAQAAKQQLQHQQQSQRQVASTSNSLQQQQQQHQQQQKQQPTPLTPTTTATSHITIDNIKNIQLIAQQFPQNSIRLVLTTPLKPSNNTNQFILATPAQQQTSFINYQLQTIPTLPNLNQNLQITKIPFQPLNGTLGHIQPNNNNNDDDDDDDDNTIENNLSANAETNIRSIPPQTDSSFAKIIRDNRNLAVNGPKVESTPTQNVHSKTIKLPNGVEVCARRVSLSSDKSSSPLSPSSLALKSQPIQQHQQIQFLQATNINDLLSNNNNQTGVKYKLIQQQQAQSQPQRQTQALRQFRLDHSSQQLQQQNAKQQQQHLKANTTTAAATTQSPTIFSTRSPRLQNRMCNVPLSPDRPTTTSTSTTKITPTTSKTIKSLLIRKRNHCRANYNLVDDEKYIAPPITDLDYTREKRRARDGSNSNSFKTIILQPITTTKTTTANKTNQLISKPSSATANFYTTTTLGSNTNNTYELQKQRQKQQQQQHRLTLSSSAAAKSFNFRPKIMGQQSQMPSSSNSNSNASCSSSSQK